MMKVSEIMALHFQNRRRKKNKKKMCAASKQPVMASYLLASHQCHKLQSIC
eukprot:UN10028